MGSYIRPRKNTDWEEKFEKSKSKINKFLKDKNTAEILSNLFSRIYICRNQLIHGSATFNSSVNREQVNDCKRILEEIIPAIALIISKNPEILENNPTPFPVIDKK